jgi:hypothetical protein
LQRAGPKAEHELLLLLPPPLLLLLEDLRLQRRSQQRHLTHRSSMVMSLCFVSCHQEATSLQSICSSCRLPFVHSW